MKKLILSGLLLFHIFYSSQTKFQESLAPLTFTLTDHVSPFTVELDFPGAYSINSQPLSDNSDSENFCSVLPPQIKSSVEWTGNIDFLTYHNFNNIQYFRNEYFIFDMASWRITVAANLSDPSTYHYIESDPSVNYQRNGNTEIPIFIIDSYLEVIYIIRSDLMVSYQLSQFYDARKTQSVIPKFKKIESNLKSYLNVKRAYYNNGHIFIVADNIVDIWTTEYTGTLVFDPPNFDSDFFGADVISISDIAFKDQHIFVLDELYGIYVINITKDGNYQHVQNLKQKIIGGKFIEIVGDSLNVIVSNKRQTILYEYTIISTPSMSLKLNRQLEIRDSVRATTSDNNFIYLMTGYYNIVTKHSIPQAFDSTEVQTSYISYWPLSNVNGFIAHSKGTSSEMLVLQNNKIIVYEFEEGKALMTCDPKGVSSGIYTYNLISTQKSCKSKEEASGADSNEMCEVSQQVSVNMNLKGASDSGQSKPLWIIGVVVGLFVFGLLVAMWYFKWRKPTDTSELPPFSKWRRLSRLALTGPDPSGESPEKSPGLPDKNHADEDHSLNQRNESDHLPRKNSASSNNQSDVGEPDEIKLSNGNFKVEIKERI